jgi:Xaa-Pro aminopeptidase
LWKYQEQLDGLNKIASGRKLTKLELNSRTGAENEICNLTREIHDLRQIKDAEDELKMIERVQNHQKTAISGYVQQRKLQFTRGKAQTEKEGMQLLKNEIRELDLTLSILESQMFKVRSLLNEASSMETSVRPLSRQCLLHCA